jgi:RNA polymerase sigma-70 factor (ECF subfamily)
VKFFKINITHLSDEALMGRLIKEDDPKVLAELYDRYSKKLLGYFINMFKGDVEKAEDFLHDLFLRIMDKKHLFKTDKKFYSWIFTIASNMCKTEFRQPIVKSLRVDQETENAKELMVEDSSQMDKAAFKNDLKNQIDQLSHEHKVVFILRYHQHFNLKDIAEITETNYGTVKSRLFYATQKITQSLKGYQPENDGQQFKMN